MSGPAAQCPLLGPCDILPAPPSLPAGYLVVRRQLPAVQCGAALYWTLDHERCYQRMLLLLRLLARKHQGSTLQPLHTPQRVLPPARQPQPQPTGSSCSSSGGGAVCRRTSASPSSSCSSGCSSAPTCASLAQEGRKRSAAAVRKAPHTKRLCPAGERL